MSIVDFDLMSEMQYEKYRHGWRCPRCNSPMVERSNRFSGNQFFGCSQFPSCRGTRRSDGSATERRGWYFGGGYLSWLDEERDPALDNC